MVTMNAFFLALSILFFIGVGFYGGYQSAMEQRKIEKYEAIMDLRGGDDEKT